MSYLLYIYVCTSCINAKIRYNWLNGKGCFNSPLPLCLWQNASCDNIFVKNSAQYKLQIIEPPWLDTVISLTDNWSAMSELITVASHFPSLPSPCRIPWSRMSGGSGRSMQRADQRHIRIIGPIIMDGKHSGHPVNYVTEAVSTMQILMAASSC